MYEMTAVRYPLKSRDRLNTSQHIYDIHNNNKQKLTSFDGTPVGTFDGPEEGEVDGSFVSSGTG